MRQIRSTYIEDDARIDVKLIIEKGMIRHFAINVAILLDDTYEDVYRIDTAHKGLHEQRFWISKVPTYLEEYRKEDYKQEFLEAKKSVLENFKKWIELHKNKRGGKHG